MYAGSELVFTQDSTLKMYYTREFRDKKMVHQMRIGKQLKRAEDTAERMLNNQLVDAVQVIYVDLDGTEHLRKTIIRG